MHTYLELDNYTLQTHRYSDRLNSDRHRFDIWCRLLLYNRLKPKFLSH